MPDPHSCTSRETSPLLPGVVGFYFAARLCLTFLLFQSDPKVGAYIHFSLHGILLVGVAFYSFGPGSNSIAQLTQASSLRWVLAFLAVGLSSLAWSVTVSEAVAFAYWCELASEVLMILLLLRIGDVETMAAAIMKGYIAGAILIAMVEWLSPTMYDLRPGDDDFFSPNAIGFTCALAVFMIQLMNRTGILWRIIAGFLAVSLLRSLSKTTIAAFVVSQGILLLLDRSRTWKFKSALVLAAGAVFWVFSGLLWNYYEVYTHLGNESETLSGRLGIWLFVLQRSVESPWIGHGFHSFRNVIPPFGSFEAWHAHNELLQQFYAYGAVGVVLLIGVYSSLLRHARKASSQALRTQLTALLMFIFIRGLADTENFDLSLPLWLVSLLSCALAAGQAATLSVAKASTRGSAPLHPLTTSGIGEYAP
ncbi:MAG TPA: O-antigen ligase family protein [Terracidiphilus sp.]|nr:O-antigen ligase family protein [Terracidiphilus sp.]